jgi:hypothetical protein
MLSGRSSVVVGERCVVTTICAGALLVAALIDFHRREVIA